MNNILILNMYKDISMISYFIVYHYMFLIVNKCNIYSLINLLCFAFILLYKEKCLLKYFYRIMFSLIFIEYLNNLY
jgi:hypothetical protein